MRAHAFWFCDAQKDNIHVLYYSTVNNPPRPNLLDGRVCVCVKAQSCSWKSVRAGRPVSVLQQRWDVRSNDDDIFLWFLPLGTYFLSSLPLLLCTVLDQIGLFSTLLKGPVEGFRRSPPTFSGSDGSGFNICPKNLEKLYVSTNPPCVGYSFFSG